MKTGRLFWGVLLTTLGVLILSVKFHIISTDWSFVWNLWPLIFIFWGLLVLLKQPIVKPVISSLFGIFVALFIFGAVSSIFFGFDFEFDNDRNYSSYNEAFVEDMDSSLTSGQLTFSSGAGAFSINGQTDKLIEGHSRGWFSNYDFNTNIDDHIAYVDVHLHEKNFKFFGNKIRNRLDMQLNPNIPWDIDFNFGAAQGRFDLSSLNVSNVKLSTGAATVEVKLGDKADETDFHVEMGASSLTIMLPQNVGCKLVGDTFLVSKKIPGFTKRGDDTYYSSNYDSTKKKVNVYVNSGVSSFSIKYY
jgi:hypothetical protein